jgi:hypothetical protein
VRETPLQDQDRDSNSINQPRHASGNRLQTREETISGINIERPIKQLNKPAAKPQYRPANSISPAPRGK